jgi:ribosome biogenesis GTPase
VIDLHDYGYNDELAKKFADLTMPGYIPGRVVADYGGFLKVVTPDEVEAEIAGALLHEVEPHQLPKVGDWVAIQVGSGSKATIRAVIPRVSEISRKAAGTTNKRQVLASNVDIAFVVQALDHDFSPMRLERYMYQLAQSNIEAIFVFNKVDKTYDVDDILTPVVAMDVPYIVTSALKGIGIDKIRARMSDGKTAVFLGSSGVGKSTLTNELLGSYQQKTAAIRESDSSGRHTTSHRELFLVPGGGMIIDTPGIRELQLWGEEEFLAHSFGDIEELALSCEFTNCSHTKELNCAVRAAVNGGTLSTTRLQSYLTFKNELQTQAFAAASESAKQKKLRARRMKKAIQLDEKLRDDEELY